MEETKYEGNLENLVSEGASKCEVVNETTSAEESIIVAEILESSGTEAPDEATEELSSFCPIFVNRDVEAELLAEQEEEEQATASYEGFDLAAEAKTVVREINRLAIKTIEQGATEIGDYVLTAVFKGKLDAVHSRNPHKSESLKQVCDDPELLIDRRRLGIWVRAAALRRELVADQVECTSLGYSQFAVLLGVADKDKQRELAIEASRDGLSVRQMMDRVKQLKQGKSTNETAKALVKKMGDPLALLKDAETQRVLDDPKELKQQLQSADRLMMARIIDDMIAKMSSSTGLLERAKRNIVMIELGALQPEEA